MSVESGIDRKQQRPSRGVGSGNCVRIWKKNAGLGQCGKKQSAVKGIFLVGGRAWRFEFIAPSL